MVFFEPEVLPNGRKFEACINIYDGDSICNEIALITPPTHGLELYTIHSMLYLSNGA